MSDGLDIGTAFETVAPVAISAVVTSAFGGGAKSGLAGGLASSAMSSVLDSSPRKSVGAKSPGLVDYIQKNPETAKLVAGLIGGAAKGWTASKDREESKRQFDAALAQRERERDWKGAFYGRP